MKKITLISVCFGVAALSGCSTVINGTHQTVSVATPAVSHAQCTLKNDKGIWYLKQTPGSVNIHRSFNDLVVMCEKKGVGKKTISVKSKTQVAAFGNIVFGGAIGAGLDVANGAAYAYPLSIQVPLRA